MHDSGGGVGEKGIAVPGDRSSAFRSLQALLSAHKSACQPVMAHQPIESDQFSISSHSFGFVKRSKVGVLVASRWNKVISR